MARNKCYIDNMHYWRRNRRFFRMKKRQRARLLWWTAREVGELSYILYVVKRNKRKNVVLVKE